MTYRQNGQGWTMDGENSGATNYRAGISRSGLVQTHFHFWNGASGRSYLHKVFKPDNLPLLVRVVVIVVAGNAHERKVLYIGQAGDDAMALARAPGFRAALQNGGNEVHVHFLSESEEARQAAEQDLTASFAPVVEALIDLAA